MEHVAVTTVAEMRAAVLERLPAATIVVKAAAPADYRPQKRAAQKIHKGARELTLALEATEDILSEVARQKGSRIVVGFAAETENAVSSAQSKLKAKQLDLVVANDVSQDDGVFDSDYNTVTIIGRGIERHLPRMPKLQVANEILDEVSRYRSGKAS